MTRPSLVFMIILTGFFLAACATGASLEVESVSETPVTSERTFLSGQSFAFSGTTFNPHSLKWGIIEFYDSPEIFRVNQIYEQGNGIPYAYFQYHHPEMALDLLIMNSKGYEAEDFYSDVLPMVGEVFGSPNVLDFNPPARFPFNYYVTSFQYPAVTPTGEGRCSVGLPPDWVPEQNFDVDQPGWNCNIALSTANGTIGVKLNLGLILHRGDIDIVDKSHYNLFSSEHNSYATILHELSHAAFAMSDEVKGDQGKFHPKDFPNVYRSKSSCNDACPDNCALIEESLTIYRCKPDDDTTNLMYFDPPPPRGVNKGWRNYKYYFPSNKRLEYIYGECAQGEC